MALPKPANRDGKMISVRFAGHFMSINHGMKTFQNGLISTILGHKSRSQARYLILISLVDSRPKKSYVLLGPVCLGRIGPRVFVPNVGKAKSL
jgi:hypothetical protein